MGLLYPTGKAYHEEAKDLSSRQEPRSTLKCVQMPIFLLQLGISWTSLHVPQTGFWFQGGTNLDRVSGLFHWLWSNKFGHCALVMEHLHAGDALGSSPYNLWQAGHVPYSSWACFLWGENSNKSFIMICLWGLNKRMAYSWSGSLPLLHLISFIHQTLLSIDTSHATSSSLGTWHTSVIDRKFLLCAVSFQHVLHCTSFFCVILYQLWAAWFYVSGALCHAMLSMYDMLSKYLWNVRVLLRLLSVGVACDSPTSTPSWSCFSRVNRLVPVLFPIFSFPNPMLRA